jgi:magnesium-transporting ATPase (P-type)
MTDPTTSVRAGRPRGYGRFYLRSFVSIMMVGFLVSFTVSGVALFVSPSGQLANATGWTLLGLSKGRWEALHVAFGFLWLPLAALHLVFNLRVVGGYLRDRVRRAFVGRRELWAAVLVTAFVGAASVLDLPPVEQLMAWGDSFNGYWAERSPNVVAATGGGAEPSTHGAGMGRYALVDGPTVVPVGKQAAARLEPSSGGLPPTGAADER